MGLQMLLEVIELGKELFIIGLREYPMLTFLSFLFSSISYFLFSFSFFLLSRLPCWLFFHLDMSRPWCYLVNYYGSIR